MKPGKRHRQFTFEATPAAEYFFRFEKLSQSRHRKGQAAARLKPVLQTLRLVNLLDRHRARIKRALNPGRKPRKMFTRKMYSAFRRRRGEKVSRADERPCAA